MDNKLNFDVELNGNELLPKVVQQIIKDCSLNDTQIQALYQDGNNEKPRVILSFVFSYISSIYESNPTLFKSVINRVDIQQNTYFKIMSNERISHSEKMHTLALTIVNRCYQKVALRHRFSS